MKQKQEWTLRLDTVGWWVDSDGARIGLSLEREEDRPLALRLSRQDAERLNEFLSTALSRKDW